MTIEKLHTEFLASSGICTDTRGEVKDSLFVALKGEHFDGNRFVPAALEEGCRLAVTGRKDLSGDPRVLVVTSPLETLQQLAHYHRMQVAPRVLAITGSNGKTTTKELVTRVLSAQYRVLATRGNLNNHIGVPLTLLSLKGEEVAVVEMGANHPGEIAALCRIAAPGTGLITNVGKAHLEGFGSLEGVLNAKGELYDYLAGTGGSAIIDVQDSLLINKARESGVTSLVVGPEGDLRVQCSITRQTPYLEVELQAGSEVYPISTGLVGAYNLQNILLAAGTGLHFGVPPSGIAEAIGGYEPDNYRSQLYEGKWNRVILDSYNANPTSMRQAIGDLLDIAKPPIMLILGEMAELGTFSEEEHKELLEWISMLKVDRVLFLGNKFYDLYQISQEKDSAQPRTRVFRDRDELEAFLQSDRPEGYHILVKGSRVNELEKIVPLL